MVALDSYDKAIKFAEKPRRNKMNVPLEDSARIVESFVLTSSDESDETDGLQIESQQDSRIELMEHRKIKQENEHLRNVIRNLNTRIGTEIIDDDNDTAVAAPQYPRNVNTLHFQNDHEFAKNIFYITNVSLFLKFSEMFCHVLTQLCCSFFWIIHGIITISLRATVCITMDH